MTRVAILITEDKAFARDLTMNRLVPYMKVDNDGIDRKWPKAVVAAGRYRVAKSRLREATDALYASFWGGWILAPKGTPIPTLEKYKWHYTWKLTDEAYGVLACLINTEDFTAIQVCLGPEGTSVLRTFRDVAMEKSDTELICPICIKRCEDVEDKREVLEVQEKKETPMMVMKNEITRNLTPLDAGHLIGLEPELLKEAAERGKIPHRKGNSAGHMYFNSDELVDYVCTLNQSDTTHRKCIKKGLIVQCSACRESLRANLAHKLGGLCEKCYALPEDKRPNKLRRTPPRYVEQSRRVEAPPEVHLTESEESPWHEHRNGTATPEPIAPPFQQEIKQSSERLDKSRPERIKTLMEEFGGALYDELTKDVPLPFPVHARPTDLTDVLARLEKLEDQTQKVELLESKMDRIQTMVKNTLEGILGSANDPPVTQQQFSAARKRLDDLERFAGQMRKEFNLQ